MKRKLLLLFIAAAAPLLSMAQGCITVFSEDGDRFYLVLNGVKQNPTPQTNVRVDGLTNDYYAAKILFDDNTKQEIASRIPVKDPASNDFAEVTYKIKHTNKGELKLRYFSATPVPPNYNPPPDMYYIHFGATAPVSSGTTVTHVSQTTTTSAAPNNASLNIGAGGVNMNINVSDPANGGGLNMNVNMGADPNMNMNTNVSQTTTTTSYTSTSTSSGGNYDAPPAQARSAACNYPMDGNSFNSAKQTIKNASFEETKLSTAKSILASNCVSTDQVVAICNLFGYEQSKLDFAKFAYSKTTDKGNYFKISNVFSFDASKTELSEFISQ
ncbi:MAG: DUF4476 domain-containing protein [Taibaiella sp.]|nr:DUF4476 domain-containing protein [Taibaiella sp.]